MRKKKPSDFFECRITEKTFLTSRGSLISGKVRTPLFVTKELPNHTIVFHLYRGHKFANLSIRDKSGTEIGVITYPLANSEWHPNYNFGNGNPWKRTKQEFLDRMNGLDSDLANWLSANI